MRKILMCLTAVAVISGCTTEWDRGKAARVAFAASTKPATADLKARTTSPRQRAATARLPDRGSLIVYDRSQASIRRAAFTQHAIGLSEAHALNAAHRGGKIDIQTPAGKSMSFAYSRHVEHGDGNWTWVGRTADGLDAVITFGAEAVVGRIAQSGTESLQLTYSNGRTWLVEADPSKLRHPGSNRALDHDVAIIPQAALASVQAKRAAKGATTASATSAVSAATGPNNTVDVVLGYTPGLVTQLGSTSIVVTTLTNRIELTNQAFASSLVTPRVRLVRTLQVNYTDTNSNSAALDALSGQTCTATACTSIPIPAELQLLRSARDQFGGDIVSLVRPLKEPEHLGCGVAWLLGPNNTTIDSTDAPFAYSVVSNGSDVRESDGFTYSCPVETLAHEMAHNMGQQHNVEDSGGDAGTHPYSYGFREASLSGFYTIMAYPAANSGQFSIPYFANPNVNYLAGRPTGTATTDNARSLNQSMLLVAQFRAPVVPFDSAPNLMNIFKMSTSGKTEVHTLSGASNYATFSQQVATLLSSAGFDFTWELIPGDFNGDGIKDLYTVYRMGASNTTEVHILNGANNFQTYLLNRSTALYRTGSANDWIFRLADYNGDGKLDLYCIFRTGGSGKTEVHILNGANNFASFLAQFATTLGSTGSDGAWAFEVADWNNDAKPDIFVFFKPGSGGSGKAEVHILNGATNFQSYLLNRATVLPAVPVGYQWDFKVADYNLDGVLDIYAINRQGGSGNVELRILDGQSSFLTLGASITTGLYNVPSNHAWEFEVVN